MKNAIRNISYIVGCLLLSIEIHQYVTRLESNIMTVNFGNVITGFIIILIALNLGD
jgi:hypothetical protein